MSNDTHNRMPATVDTAASFIVQIDGPAYVLIAPGEYDAYYHHHETMRHFGKPQRGPEGKLILWFEISAPGTDADKVRVFKAYNAKQLLGHAGKNGRFKMGGRSNYLKDHERLFGRRVSKRGADHGVFTNKLYLVKIKTVTTDRQQKPLHPNNQYSVIEEILEVLVGALPGPK